MTDYPQGDGFPDCPHCRGRGCVSFKAPYLITPATKVCVCVSERDRFSNMEKRWKGLSRVEPPDESPLLDYVGQNLRITAKQNDLRAHLHKVALEMPSSWFFAVESDRELAAAWLYTKKLDGTVLDPDVVTSAPKYLSLEDLSDHADLLILLLGVKAARNSATPELLVDVVQGRGFLDKPTWVVDGPHYPLVPGHISYSSIVELTFDDWDHVFLEGAETVEPDHERLAAKPHSLERDADPAYAAGKEEKSELDKLMTASRKPTKGKRGRKP